MDKDKIEERRRNVKRLMLMGMASHLIAELLGCARATVHADMKLVREQMIEAAACVSGPALIAHEEIEAILQLAHDLHTEMSLAQGAKDKAKLAEAAAHCYFLAGRLKQRRDP